MLASACVQGSNCLLMVNGFVAAFLPANVQVRVPIHEFIVSGENRLHIRSAEGSTHAASQNMDIALHIELYKDRGPSALVQGDAVCALSKSVEQGEFLQDGILLQLHVNLPVSFPAWRMFDLVQVETNGLDLAPVSDFMRLLRGHFTQKNVNALLPYFSNRNRELAVAYGLDAQDVFERFSAHLVRLCTECELQAEGFDPHTWRFVQVGRSCIWFLGDSNCKPVFRFQHRLTQQHYALPMHVAVLNGEVFVVR